MLVHAGGFCSPRTPTYSTQTQGSSLPSPLEHLWTRLVTLHCFLSFCIPFPIRFGRADACKKTTNLLFYNRMFCNSLSFKLVSVRSCTEIRAGLYFVRPRSWVRVFCRARFSLCPLPAWLCLAFVLFEFGGSSSNAGAAQQKRRFFLSMAILRSSAAQP